MPLSLSRLKARQPEAASYHVLQQWLIETGVLLFALSIAHQYHVIVMLIGGDTTRVTLLIALIFVVAWCYSGVRSFWLSREAARFDVLVARVADGCRLRVESDGGLNDGHARLADSAGGAYVAGLLGARHRTGAHAEPPETLIDLLGETLQGAHEFGWFICGLLIKLGLLGTVIGFIVMLATVDSMRSFDVGAIQQLLVGMSHGMRVSLYTTLVGLAGSMVLSLHYLLLDRAADRLQSRIVHFAQRQHLV